MNWEVRTMRSATSYFNYTLYRKTLARFWPLWGGYGVLWLFALPLHQLNEFMFQSQAYPELTLLEALTLPYVLGFGLFMAVTFSILSAMAVFGYLYNSRSACWFHALPLRREALFTTQYLAGLSFLILPLLCAGALAAVVEVSFLPTAIWGRALTALLITLITQSGMCLFFFSFAVFCAMFTGHILALPVFYGILNGLAMGVYTLVYSLMEEFFYGYNGNAAAYQIIRYLTPVDALMRATRWSEDTDRIGSLESPGVIAAYAAVGVLLAVFSLYVYRRRHVETAGDVVAVPLVRPLFKYGVAFCSGLAFGVFTFAFFGWHNTGLPLLVCSIVIWSVVGCFAAEMLLRKSFRVFKRWKGPAATAAVMLAVCLVCFLDVFGVVSRVPDPAQVDSVYVDMTLGYPYDSGMNLNKVLTDPDQIQEICELHRAVVSDSRWNDLTGEDIFHLTLSYTLKGGGQLNRRYFTVAVRSEDFNREGSISQLYQDILEDRELVEMAYGFDEFLEDARLTGARLDDLQGGDGSSMVYLDGYERELWDAVRADFAEGTLGARYFAEYGEEHRENTYRTDLVFEATPIQDWTTSDDVDYFPETPATRPYSRSLSVTLTPHARHTLAVLDKTGVWEEGWALSTYEGAYNPKYPDTESW